MNMPDAELPRRYQILPASIDFVIPGFRRFYTPGDKTLALSQRDSAAWFHEFVDRLAEACGREYLPVCRMSDGEFLFALGDQPPDVRLPWRIWGRHLAAQMYRRWRRLGRFEAQTPGHYHSGTYTWQEWQRDRSRYAYMIRELSQKGILALHLSYGQAPFQEHYFPALGRWLCSNEITLTEQNYVPFYFVYAALTGPRRGELLRGRRLLVVNGAEGAKRSQIEAGLAREGAAEIHWLPISLTRSWYDRLDVQEHVGKVDLALVGAGIGKPNILLQLEPLQAPCIDAGFVFEVWADPENRWRRPVCVPDEP
jgi:hypothetical protein